MIVLEFNNGSKEVLLPPPVLSPSGKKWIRKHALIKEWHRLLLDELVQHECQLWGPEHDQICYAIAQPFYEKIWRLLDLSTDETDPQCLNQLVPECRHRLFIGNEPFQRDGKWIIGLSNLEKLLGQEALSDEQAEGRSGGDKTTGAEELDVIASTVLIFKRRGLELATIYSASELYKMCVLANKLQAVEEEDDKTVKVESDTPEKTPELEILEQNKDVVLARLKAMGVQVPANF